MKVMFGFDEKTEELSLIQNEIEKLKPKIGRTIYFSKSAFLKPEDVVTAKIIDMTPRFITIQIGNKEIIKFDSSFKNDILKILDYLFQNKLDFVSLYHLFCVPEFGLINEKTNDLIKKFNKKLHDKEVETKKFEKLITENQKKIDENTKNIKFLNDTISMIKQNQNEFDILVKQNQKNTFDFSNNNDLLI